MKKFMLLGVTVAAIAVLGLADTAQAGHGSGYGSSCYSGGGGYYGGGYSTGYYGGGYSTGYYGGYRRPYSGLSVGYYSPRFSLSIGSGYRSSRYGSRSHFSRSRHHHH